ncbi:MAG: RAMP superfamily CRISPR-associated protein [Methylobacter sp.]|uniref:RAMP superfamily CRISPR-associated protein n=1 Tax=Methylobacter sp. TaxID=2051955 RepID=UPI0025848412|nr:RAMP superfamily CRISPR-associated protein [Methylobacter sp.]MCL7421627.1 RAMP superfamily CRISPR-associated protein [Methylobacter sp.]
MSNFLQNYTLKYTPLSPIHIGADESYEPGNYVIDDEAGALYGFDSQAALSGLSENDRQQLLAIVNGKPDDFMLTKVQAFFHQHREKLLAFARPPVPTASGVKALYEKRIGKTAQHEGKGRRVINKLEIERTFYNPADARPLLPGSSIKGAIRTALLDAVNNGKSLIARNERNQQLQQRLFEGQFHTDPMRLISIGDAAWQAYSDKPACQVQFAVNRKRKPVMKNGQLVQSQAEASNLYQLLECVAPNHYQSFTGSLTLHNTQSIAQDNRKLPQQRFHWPVKAIAEACNAFYMGLFWQEMNAMKERRYLKTGWLNNIEQLMENGLLKRLNDGEAFLLRIGRHSGAEALTLDGVRNIRIMQGRGEKPAWEKQPRTWWLAADDIADKQALLPFGWILVEIDPKTPDCQLQQWLENAGSGLTAWMQQQLNKQNQLRQQAELRLRKEQEKRQAEQQLAEEMRLKQQAEQLRLASMTDEQLQIDALRQKLQQKQAANLREQIGGPLYGDLRVLINLATAWPANDKAELLDVAKTILEFIGASGNKKAKELLKSLQ